jgi:Bacterial regulatory protein, arsR family
VTALAERPRYVHELVELLGVSQPLVSQHLRILRGARLVVVERLGREAVYSLADPHVAHIVGDAVQHSNEIGGVMPTADHDAHIHPEHEHGPGCGHASANREGHTDYVHDGHAHTPHDGHYDEHPLPHLAHPGHGHVHGPGCGHEPVPHEDHVDYTHDGHRHAADGDHYDEH